MGKKIRWSVFVAVALASSTAAAALQGGGTRSVSDVTITQDSNIADLWTASGSLGDARYLTSGVPLPTILAYTIPGVVLPANNPIDIKKYIGCGLKIDKQGMLATCWAQKPHTLPPYTPPVAQDSVLCISDDLNFMAVVASIKGDSMLTFSLLKTSGICTSINVENSSQHYPKAP